MLSEIGLVLLELAVTGSPLLAEKVDVQVNNFWRLFNASLCFLPLM